uniref:Phenylalanine ammonia-lyase n=1 Tax=Struthiopteris spicant TaxID=114457 RepID=Q5EP59_STRUS|nr:phenylalanine ammonia lyase [Struthiopteris spicant]
MEGGSIQERPPPALCLSGHVDGKIAETPHWLKAAEAMQGSHFEEVKCMVREFLDTKEVVLRGSGLTVGQVAAVTDRVGIHVALDEADAKARVDESADWVLKNVGKFTTGFGASSANPSSSGALISQAADLQNELIRFLNAGVIGHDDVCLPPKFVKASMLIRANTLLQGFSGIRWEILDALAKLVSAHILPKIPLRGSLTASGDLIPLAYIAALLIGRPNCIALTPQGEEIRAIAALKLAGIDAPFQLLPKEGIALVNGTTVGSAVAAKVCFDANVLVLLAEVLSALFCEVMQGKPEFTDPLTHQLKHHPGQIEAAAVMEYLLEGSSYMRAAAKLNATNPLSKPKQDRYALRTSPQWLGPQVEVIRAATHSIEREINSVNDNPLIDVSRNLLLKGGNFQGTPIGVSMDNMRIAVAAIGKLMFAQFSELVCDYYNSGLPSNLSGGPDLSLDYSFKGAEIAMAAYCSELQYLANPVTTHVQSAEQHNEDVNSLGLIAARKTAEAVDILKLMSSTFLIALCQAVDLRHMEETMQAVVKHLLTDAIKATLYTENHEGTMPNLGFLEGELMKVVEYQPIFSYIDNPSNPNYALMMQLRETLVEQAMKDTSLFRRIPIFEAHLKKRLDEEVPKARERFEKGDYAMASRISKCRTYPLYKFVREELGTDLLRGNASRSPGEDIEKLFMAMVDGKVLLPMMKCMEGWRGMPGPFTPHTIPASPAPIDPASWTWFDNSRTPSSSVGTGYWSTTV